MDQLAHTPLQPEKLGQLLVDAGAVTPRELEQVLELQKQHQDAMGKHVAAMKDFYAQLTPEQKKTFDEQTQMGKRGPRGGGRGPGPQGPGNPPPAN